MAVVGGRYVFPCVSKSKFSQAIQDNIPWCYWHGPSIRNMCDYRAALLCHYDNVRFTFLDIRDEYDDRPHPWDDSFNLSTSILRDECLMSP